MAVDQQKHPLGLGDIATRPVTYAALALLAGGYLVLILWLHAQITARVVAIEQDVRALRQDMSGLRSEVKQDIGSVRQEVSSLRDVVYKTREEAASFQAEVRGEFKQMNARFDRLEELIIQNGKNK